MGLAQRFSAAYKEINEILVALGDREAKLADAHGFDSYWGNIGEAFELQTVTSGDQEEVIPDEAHDELMELCKAYDSGQFDTILGQYFDEQNEE